MPNSKNPNSKGRINERPKYKSSNEQKAEYQKDKDSLNIIWSTFLQNE